MDFYYSPGSAPCRSVIMTAQAIGITLNLKVTDLRNGAHMTPEYLKMNPQHTIPTLNDNGFSVWESRAIMAYLVEKYAKTDSLYPQEPQKRALINQRLYFDMNLYMTFGTYFYPPAFQKIPYNPELLQKFEAQMQILNTFLKGQNFAVGESLTIADFALLATVSTAVVVGVIDLDKYANIKTWYENCKAVAPGFKENWEGCLLFKKYFE